MFEYGQVYKIPHGLTPSSIREEGGENTDKTLEDLGIEFVYYFGYFVPGLFCFEAEGKDEVDYIIYFEPHPRMEEFTVAQ